MMVFSGRLYYFQPIIAVVVWYESLVCEFVSCQTDHHPTPTEATGIPQSVLLTLIGVVGSLLGATCLTIVCLLCFYARRIRQEKDSSLQQDRSKTDKELNPTRILHIKPPVIGSTVHDVSKVVELGDSQDMLAVGAERAFATLVDRPALNPEAQRIDSDNVTVEETKVVYMANYQRRFTDITDDDDTTWD